MYQHSLRKPDGYRISVDAEGRSEERDTRQCCHCGGHFDFVKGSGRLRGFCTKCMKITCGSPLCHAHYAIEKRMDDYERGLLPEINSPVEAILPKYKKIILPNE